jgi:hypothetical protein
MLLNYISSIKQISIPSIVILLIINNISSTAYAADNTPSISNATVKSTIVTAKPAPVKIVKDDYFISADTVIIGCTSGMAAGILVGSVPVAGAVMSGIGLPESVNLLINMTGMGCGVGAVSGAVAILTAWMLQPD